MVIIIFLLPCYKFILDTIQHHRIQRFPIDRWLTYSRHRHYNQYAVICGAVAVFVATHVSCRIQLQKSSSFILMNRANGVVLFKVFEFDTT